MTPFRPKRLFVTGGRGRLASLIVDYFRAPAHPVLLYSRGAGPGFRDYATLAESGAMQEADTLLHLAWSTLPASSEQNPGSEQQHDLPQLQKMLSVLAALSPEQRPHFIFFSSGGTVYGNAPGRPNQEGDACHPIGSYGRAKLAAEHMIQNAAQRHDLPCAILRISNPYGYPVPSGRMQGIIPHAIRAALGGHPLTLWGDGQARKDFLYYTDFLSALQEIVDRRLTGIYNLCAGESHTVQEIIQLVESHTGRRITSHTTPAPAWDVKDSRLDNTRLIAATGWQPQVSLGEGIRRSTAGYLDR
jgi:UDP-glucose 4-epimerase